MDLMMDDSPVDDSKIISNLQELLRRRLKYNRCPLRRKSKAMVTNIYFQLDVDSSEETTDTFCGSLRSLSLGSNPPTLSVLRQSAEDLMRESFSSLCKKKDNLSVVKFKQFVLDSFVSNKKLYKACTAPLKNKDRIDFPTFMKAIHSIRKAALIKMKNLFYFVQENNKESNFKQLLLCNSYTVFFNLFDIYRDGWLSVRSLVTVSRLALVCNETDAEQLISSILGTNFNKQSIITFKVFYKLLACK